MLADALNLDKGLGIRIKPWTVFVINRFHNYSPQR
jgi:hypothetical protein